VTKDISIEYAHIYTNKCIGDEQKLSLEVLGNIKQVNINSDISLVVMVDDYSFPDPSFDYEMFTQWLSKEGYKADLIFRESQLIPLCDDVLNLLSDATLKNEICDYIRAKKYPCSLFVATWYLLRLGEIRSGIFDESLVSNRLINILPISLKPFEDKAFDIIRATRFSDCILRIDNQYFEGRIVV